MLAFLFPRACVPPRGHARSSAAPAGSSSWWCVCVARPACSVAFHSAELQHAPPSCRQNRRRNNSPDIFRQSEPVQNHHNPACRRRDNGMTGEERSLVATSQHKSPRWDSFCFFCEGRTVTVMLNDSTDHYLSQRVRSNSWLCA